MLDKIQTFLPILSNALGRDLSIELNMFFRARASIGSALNQQGQEFFIKNWPTIIDFMETPQGQKAISDFMDKWVASLIPPSITAKPDEPVQSPQTA